MSPCQRISAPRWAPLICVWAVTLACQADKEPEEPVKTSDGVRFRLTWRTDAATMHPSGGWSADGGASVRQGWLVTRGLQMVDCPDEGAVEGFEQALAARSWVPWALAGPSARAGHGGSVHETALGVPWVERLDRPAETIIDVATPASDMRLCGVHWLVGRAQGDAVGLPEGVEPKLGRTTLRLDSDEGMWLRTDLANGSLTNLRRPVVAGPGRSVEVTIERDLATLTAGSAEPEGWAREALTSLMASVRVVARQVR